jgi:hypothetical protein
MCPTVIGTVVLGLYEGFGGVVVSVQRSLVMGKLLTLTIVTLMVVACTTIAPPTPSQTEMARANVPVATTSPPTSPTESELSTPRVTAEKPSPPTPTATVASPTTTSPPPLPEPPDDAEALKLMYPNEDASAHKVILSAPFRQEGYDKHLILTDNILVNHCSACPVYVEAALFVYHNDVWQLENLHQVAAEFSTNGDNLPTAVVIPFGPAKDGIIFGSGYQGQGYLISTDIYVTDVGGQFRQVFSLTTFENNRISDACFEQQLCYEYGATVDIVRGDNPIYFDMRVTAGGTNLIDEQLVEFTEVATYTFTGEVYTLTEKKDGYPTTPTPMALPTPTALGLEGPSISYGGISFTVDPALGDKVFVDQTLDPLSCTHFSFASEGSCQEVGCVTVCPVASYREEILFGDDIIDGLQSAIERQSNGYFPSLMAHILLRAQTQHIAFQNGAGISAIVMKGQNLVFANNESVAYEFHGLTADGQYYVMVIFPIDASILLSTYDPEENTNEAAIPAPELPNDDRQIGIVMREYNQEAQRQLDLPDGSSFIPDLELLNALVGSLRVAPPTSSTAAQSLAGCAHCTGHQTPPRAQTQDSCLTFGPRFLGAKSVQPVALALRSFAINPLTGFVVRRVFPVGGLAHALLKSGNWNIPLLSTASKTTSGFIRQLLGDGTLGGYKAGGRDWLIPLEIGDAWLASRNITVDIDS